MLLQDEGQDDVINRAVHPGAQNAPRCVSAPKSARLDMRTEDPVKTTTLVKPGMKGELLIARVHPLTPGDSASKVMASWAMPPPVPSPPTCLPQPRSPTAPCLSALYARGTPDSFPEHAALSQSWAYPLNLSRECSRTNPKELCEEGGMWSS